MSIREKGYTGWDGELQPRKLTWLPIARLGIRTVFRKRFAKLLFAVTLSPSLIFLLMVYLTTKPELKMAAKIIPLLQNDATMFDAFFTNGFLVLMLMLVTIFAGADLVSGDLKARAFPLYFARPLSRRDYLFGKFSVILFYILLFTLVPGLLLILFKVIFLGRFDISLRVFFAMILFPLVLGITLSAIAMIISTLSANTKIIQVIIFLVYTFSDGLAAFLQHIFHNDYFWLISLPRNIEQLGKCLFGLPGVRDFPPVLSLLLFLGYSAIFILLLGRLIRKAEARI
jgi:hypothetical protein